MNPKLLAFLKKHTSFNEDVLEEIMSAMQVETYKKGALLLRQGDISSKCYVVLEGCIRQYTIGEDGKEITNNFFTEEQTVTLFMSYKKECPQIIFCPALKILFYSLGILKRKKTCTKNILNLKRLHAPC